MLSTQAPVLDYSAVQVLVGWLVESASQIPSGLLDPVEAPLQSLKESITFDSGHGQQEIWLAYLHRTSHKSFRDLVQRLQTLFDGASTTHANFSSKLPWLSFLDNDDFTDCSVWGEHLELRSTALTLSATYGLDLAQDNQDGSDALQVLEKDVEKVRVFSFLKQTVIASCIDELSFSFQTGVG